MRFTSRPLGLLRSLVVVMLLIGMAGFAAGDALSRQVASDFAPTSGNAQVIAQGVATLPAGDVVWRTVRTRAMSPQESLFEARPLGFVLATDGPLLLTDQEQGEQTRLGRGEAAFVPAGVVQRRASLTEGAVSYLSIELVPADAPAPPDDAIVLQPGQPFAAPAGLRDLDLVSDTVRGDDVYAVPDSGAKNVVLITDGAANVGRPGGNPVVLLAGEAASFTGELAVGAAPGDGEPVATFVVAMIGPEVPAPPGLEAAPTAAAVTATEATPSTIGEPTTQQSAGQGEVTVQVFTCPPGMTAESLAAAVCEPVADGFDLALAGEALAEPLTVQDADMRGNAVTWSGLPPGDYVISEPQLPAGATTYVLSARKVTGDAASGYTLKVSADAPVKLRIYNLAP
ncbi:MAG: hypothetical protein U0031_18080 [Thermomicrobiales bacterium]